VSSGTTLHRDTSVPRGTYNAEKRGDLDESEKSSESGYEDRGEEEIEEDGVKRKVKVVLEKKSGREVTKDIVGGPYTRPRWYVIYTSTRVRYTDH
jgi:hypothetical protein